MRFCTNCGSKMDDSANFCMKCGKKVELLDHTIDVSSTNRTVNYANNVTLQAKASNKFFLKPALIILAIVIVAIIAVITLLPQNENTSPDPIIGHWDGTYAYMRDELVSCEELEATMTGWDFYAGINDDGSAELRFTEIILDNCTWEYDHEETIKYNEEKGSTDRLYRFTARDEKTGETYSVGIGFQGSDILTLHILDSISVIFERITE